MNQDDEKKINKAEVEQTLCEGACAWPGVDKQRFTLAYKRKGRSSHWEVHVKGRYVELVWNLSPRNKLFRSSWRIAMKEVQEVMRPHWPVELDHLPKVREA